ncbi:MAG: hypothetical protein JWM93_4016 [Frankiales bacterium]|nr:hypothetical protein [Frankiales bacterium]MCW3013886.1 hypothetical protein [Solirubrobacterales bacterium]
MRTAGTVVWARARTEAGLVSDSRRTLARAAVPDREQRA